MQHILQMEGKIECTHVWSVVFSKKKIDYIPKGNFTYVILRL